jgi:hypothetical protein
MVVYVDDMRAPFRDMIMCHMIADDTEELMAMADAIGMDRKWIQRPGTPYEHFDLSEPRRASAIEQGAIAVTMRELGRMIQKRRRAAQAAAEGGAGAG